MRIWSNAIKKKKLLLYTPLYILRVLNGLYFKILRREKIFFFIRPSNFLSG